MSSNTNVSLGNLVDVTEDKWSLTVRISNGMIGCSGVSRDAEVMEEFGFRIAGFSLLHFHS